MKKSRIYSLLIIAGFAISAHSQTYNAMSGGYNTGYGTVYGSFGLANATQNLYNSTQLLMQKSMARNLMIKKWGLAAVEKAEREAKSGSAGGSKTGGSAASPKIVVPPAPVVRNHGVFRPSSTVDTGKTLSENLGDTAEEKALIKQIYTLTKAAYDQEAAARGFKNNIAGGLTFFTVTAMTVFHDAEEPPDSAVDDYFKILNAALDEIPEFAKVANKDKQGFNDMLIGFSGILIASYTEAKQTNDPETLAASKKLAAMLIEMVLKTDPENIRVENGQIVMN